MASKIKSVGSRYKRDTSGFVDSEAITPSDTVNFTKGVSRAIWVGTGGNIVGVTASGTTTTLTNVPSGFMLTGQYTRINSTNTTASNLVALY